MGYIYEPKGRAKEYSLLALNLFLGCNHGCVYCYNKDRFPNYKVVKRAIDLILFERELIKNRYNKQVMLSFVGDICCELDVYQRNLVKNVLELLCKYNVPVAILTKGGTRLLQYLPVISRFKNIKVGATLTFDNDEDSFKYEPGAEPYTKRVEMLEILHSSGIRTFVSLEPFFSFKKAVSIIDKTYFVNEYLVGKINYYDFDFVEYRTEKEWATATVRLASVLNYYKKDFYIKESLQKCLIKHGVIFKEKHFDSNYLTLKGEGCEKDI